MSLSIYIFLICFLALPYFIIYLRNLIWDVYLWQVKEYRFDRVFSQLLYEKVHGVRSMLSTYFKIGLLTLIVVFFISNNSEYLLFFTFMSFFLYWYESMDFFPKLLRKKLHRPDIRSPRNLILITGTVMILILPFFWLGISLPNPASNSSINTDNILSPKDLASELTPYLEQGVLILRPEYLIIFWSSVFGIMGELVSPIITALLVILTRPLAYAKRRNILKLAREKLAAHANVKVIAVTGSYGKSTTKEILYQLLSPFYETIKTEKNNNTDVGIAQTILKKLNKDTEIFIAEMGAYKLGETRDCCLIAPPNIAIITGIDQQHLSLYGSIKAVLDSTYEVVEFLNRDGLVIFNGDNEYCLKLAERTKVRKQFYFTVDSVEKLVAHNYDHKVRMESGHEYPAPDNISVSEVKETAKGLQLRLRFRESEHLLKTSLKAQYNISNLMAAILVALELGVPLDKLVKVINETDFHVPNPRNCRGGSWRQAGRRGRSRPKATTSQACLRFRLSK